MSKSHKSVLDSLKIASPCSEQWDSMSGNEKVRFCSHCALQVHDLSAMTTVEAMSLVGKSGGRLCVRYYRQQDGTIRTATQTLHNIKRRASILAAGAFGATLSLCASVSAQTPATNQPAVSGNVEAARQRDAARPQRQEGLSAGLAGAVTDSAGGAVPAAKVILVDEQTKLEQTMTTTDDGAFKFQALPAGNYSIRIEGPQGLSNHEIKDIQLVAGEERRVDATLEPVGFLTGLVVVVAEPEDLIVKAVHDDDLVALKGLVATGADVNVVDRNVNSTALMKAVSNGNQEIVKFLLHAGADPNVRNINGRTALMMLGAGPSIEIVRALLSAGARVNRKDEEGNTALINAATVENGALLQALLDAGAKVNAKDNAGRTALMVAVGQGNVENVKVLLAAGADVNRKNKNDETALSIARNGDSAEIVSLLAAYGASDENR